MRDSVPQGVPIPSQHPRPGKLPPSLPLDTLRPAAVIADRHQPTARTASRCTLAIVTPVAERPPPIRMEDERDVTVWALDDVTAGAALNERRRPPTIEIENRLLPLGECLLHQLDQPSTEEAGILVAQLFTHIDNFNVRQLQRGW